MSTNDLTTYYQKRKFIRSGDALQWKSNKPLGKAIRIWSPGYNHTAMAVQLEFHHGVKDARWIIEADKGGVQFHILSRELERYPGEVWWFKVSPALDEYRDAVAAWAVNKEGTPYDYGSLFKNILGRVSANANALFCSELFFMAWKEVLQGKFDKHGLKKDFGMEKAPRPGDIWDMGIFMSRVRIV